MAKNLKISKKTISKLSQDELRRIDGGKDTLFRFTDGCNKSDLICPTGPIILPNVD
jgi:hypothetical protein